MDVKITGVHWQDFGIADADRAAQGKASAAALFRPVVVGYILDVRMHAVQGM